MFIPRSSMSKVVGDFDDNGRPFFVVLLLTGEALQFQDFSPDAWPVLERFSKQIEQPVPIKRFGIPDVVTGSGRLVGRDGVRGRSKDRRANSRSPSTVSSAGMRSPRFVPGRRKRRQPDSGNDKPLRLQRQFSSDSLGGSLSGSLKSIRSRISRRFGRRKAAASPAVDSKRSEDSLDGIEYPTVDLTNADSRFSELTRSDLKLSGGDLFLDEESIL